MRRTLTVQRVKNRTPLDIRRTGDDPDQGGRQAPARQPLQAKEIRTETTKQVRVTERP